MRQIPIVNWAIKMPDGTEGTENLLAVLSALITMKKPEELPRGFEQFKMFTKLTKAFEKAEQTQVLELEEKEYKFLNDAVLKEIPAVWGANKNIVDSITSFIEAKEL